MASVVPSYQHDIFMSYAHVDDVPFAGIEHGWVSNLFRALSTALSAKVGPVSVASAWQAVQSEDNVVTPADVLNHVAQSAILLVVLSPGYLASEQCRTELDHFIRATQAQTDLPPPRIVVVEKNRLEQNQLPAALAELPSQRFWTLDQRRRERTLAMPQPNPHEALYYQKIDDLAIELARTLEQMRLERDPTSPSVPPPPPLATVYLAQVSEDLHHERDGVKRYLEQFNVRVLPDQDVPAFRIERDQSDLDRLLAASDLFVQLLGDQTQWRLPQRDIDWPLLQYERAEERNLSILQWRSPTLDLTTVAVPQRAFLALETVKAMHVEEFKRAIRQRLTTGPPTSPSADHYVFLNTSDVDQRLATQIGRILTQLGLVWLPRLNEGSPARMRQDLESHLRTCDALVVVYGEIGAPWVSEQLRYYRRIRRAQPVKALAL